MGQEHTLSTLSLIQSFATENRPHRYYFSSLFPNEHVEVCRYLRHMKSICKSKLAMISAELDTKMVKCQEGEGGDKGPISYLSNGSLGSRRNRYTCTRKR